MAFSGQTLPLNVLEGALPANFSPSNWQEAANMIASRLQISIDQAYALFNIGSVLPDQNIGPILLNGEQWYVWDDTLAKYIIMPLDDDQLKYIISTTAPDPAQFLIWWQIDSSGLPVVPNYYNVGAAAWQPFGYSIAQIDALFAGQSGGKAQISWENVTSKPTLFANNMVGTTAQRTALSPTAYNLFFDTDINALLVFYAGIWHTVDGCPGDVKFASAASIGVALTNNPGWSQNTSATARFLVSAGDGSGSGLSIYTNGQTGGAEDVTLAQNQLPASMTGLSLTGPSAGGAGPTEVNFQAAQVTETQTMPTVTMTNPGGGQPTDILPPFIAYWCLIKN